MHKINLPDVQETIILKQATVDVRMLQLITTIVELTLHLMPHHLHATSHFQIALLTCTTGYRYEKSIWVIFFVFAYCGKCPYYKSALYFSTGIKNISLEVSQPIIVIIMLLLLVKFRNKITHLVQWTEANDLF